jgi:hypothetical protein
VLANADDDLDADEIKNTTDVYSHVKDKNIDRMKYVKMAVWLVVFVTIVVLYFTNDWLVG